ncbi:PIN domain-containing protein [Phragmitibacter flavus]|uniref:PIN domain-containing protein n=2 Tax=Phragmitibacter flavus TaxID=2576071 RepID=A0A5R8KAF1_9BACT|nr:PIN domain-containing protein [Phragmitibacter flavus]
MISVDANILLYSYSEASPFHGRASQFLESLSSREDVGISEFILTEFYLHLRNPAVLQKPLSSKEAASVVDSYRQHPNWRILGFPPRSRDLHTALWQMAAGSDFARRRIYGTRTALSLIAFGVTEFATANLKDFQGFGFKKLWNPCEPSSLPQKGSD